MQLWILNIIFLAFCAIGANSLECYNCLGDGCTSMNDSMLHYCGPESTTTTDELPTTTTSTSFETTSGMPTFSTMTTNKVTENTRSSMETSTRSSTPTTTSTTTETTGSTTLSTSDATAETNTPTAETTLSTSTASTIAEIENELTLPLRQRRSLYKDSTMLITNTPTDSNYYCYSASIPDGDSSKQKHGCVEIAAGQEPCDAVRELNSIPANTDTSYGCKACQTDKCNINGAGYMQGISMLTLLAVLMVQKFIV